MGQCWPDKTTVIMKNSLKWVSGFNISAILCDTIFVSRFGKGEGPHPALEQAVDKRKNKGLKIWIFPEGRI